MRRLHVGVTLLVILTLVVPLGLVPPPAVATPAADPPGASLVPADAEMPAPPLSQPRTRTAVLPPPEARSTGISSDAVDQIAAQVEGDHTQAGLFDGAFTTPRSVRHIEPGPFSLGDGSADDVETIFRIGPDIYDDVAVDVTLTSGHTVYASWARIAFRPVGSAEWTEEVSVADASPMNGRPTVTETNRRVTLGVSVPRHTPLEVRLRCHGTNPTCTWSNLRFYTETPGWRYTDTNAKWPLHKQIAGVEPAAYRTIEPIDGPFLALESFHHGGGVSHNSWYALRGPVIRLPLFSASDTLTMSVQWARHRTIDDPEQEMAGADIGFVSLDDPEQPITKLIAIPKQASDDPWTYAASKKLPTTLSGVRGQVRIVSSQGWVPRVLAFDNITFYLNGAPLTFPLIPADQVAGKCSCDVCAAVQHVHGDPVNTASGAFYLQATDVTVASDGLALTLARTYVSLFADPDRYPTTTLGPGWRHSQDTALTLPDQPGGEANTIIYEAPSGNRLRFYVSGSNEYVPAVGVRATIVESSTGYTVTTSLQQIEGFDLQGRLVSRRDPQGRQAALTYYAAPGAVWDGRLERVTDETTQRTLTFTYGAVGGQPRLQTVRDSAGRSVSYTYTSAGDLATVTDLRGAVTTYNYDGASRLLTQVIDPANVVRVTNTYRDGRVTQQEDAVGLTTTYTYTADPEGTQTTITRQRAEMPPDVWTDHYRPDGSLRFQEQNDWFKRYTTFDSGCAPQTLVDGGDNRTQVTSNAVGRPTQITNALDETTQVAYNDQNLPTVITDTLLRRSELAYDADNNLIRQTTSITNSFPGFTAHYTYNVRHPGKSWLEEQRNPDNFYPIRYDYDSLGQMIKVTQGGGHSQGSVTELITEYGYDDLGRVITTTVGSPKVHTITRYNADDTVAETIQNYQDGVFDPSHPDTDIVTSYGYDDLGRSIWVRNVLGRYDVTHYDAAGRVDWTAHNLTGYSGGASLPAQPPAFDPAAPDANVATFYGYDGLGRTSLVTQTGILTGTFDPSLRRFSAATERVTRTEYDALSRPVTVTLNYRPGVPAGPDVNVQTLTYYDGADNVIWQRDALGRWDYTEYDALNRPITVTLNYENGDPLTVGAANQDWATITDTDIIQVTRYTADGQIDRVINNYVDGNFTVTDPILDRITLYEYDVAGRGITTTLAYDPPTLGTRTDTNRSRVTAYDQEVNRVLGWQDALGRWTAYRYDGVGRVEQVTQNCYDQGSPAPSANCEGQTDDRNVVSRTYYDWFGRPFETVDPLGAKVHTDYDGVGRPVAVIRNPDSSSEPTSDTHVTTETAYNGLGWTTVMTDALGAAMQAGHDALGRTVVITNSVGRVSRTGYDGTGAPRWQETPDGRFTVMQVDGLGRVVATIQNYQDGVVGASEPVDQDLVTRTTYDAGGRAVQTSDPSRRVTALAYDLRDNLTSVTENAVAGSCPSDPCNVVTQYQYDRAGNQLAVIDARGVTTQRASYDAADRQIAWRDGLDQITRFEYDRTGQVLARRDPRGSTYDVTYGYDELGRQTTIDSPEFTVPITATYDSGGRRLQLGDPTGVTSFSYNRMNQITAVEAPTTGLVQYGYNARGQRTQMTYPSGAVINYTYWPDGQLEGVHQRYLNLASYTYDDAGRLAQVTRPAGRVATSYRYDAADRLRSLITTTDDQMVSSFDYQVDRVSNRTLITETLSIAGGNGRGAADVALDAAAGRSLPGADTSISATTGTRPDPTRLLPLAFIPNVGQSASRVRFQARGLGGLLFFTPTEVVLALPSRHDNAQWPPDATTQPPPTVLRVQFDGVQATTQITGTTILPGIANYFIGNDPARWRTNIPTYAGLHYRNLYPGIDLAYDGANGSLKGVYTVAPGRDPAQIRWRYTGADHIQLDAATGDLLITLPSADSSNVSRRTLAEQAPIAWQEIAGRRVAIAVRYTIYPDESIGFVVDDYDPTLPLIIDPTLTWSTFLGGNDWDGAAGIARDEAGNIYLTGSTYSTDFPTHNPLPDNSGYAFVTKLSPDGQSIIYSTYLGGAAFVEALQVAVDRGGQAAITGTTADDAFPLVNPIQATRGGGQDAFVTQLNASGNGLVFSTYLGGSDTDYGFALDVDSANNLSVAGSTNSTDFPTINSFDASKGGGSDGFITRLDPTASALIYSTYLGGDGDDSIVSLAIDSSDATVVAGSTAAANFPLAPPGNPLQNSLRGSQDAFVTKLSADGGTLVFSTYLGGSGWESVAIGYETGGGVAVDGAGNAYVTGTTDSRTDFPTQNPLQAAYGGGETDAFVSIIAADGSAFRASTYLGGNAADQGRVIGVDASGYVVVAGATESRDFPLYYALQTIVPSLNPLVTASERNVFVSMLTPDGQALRASSYLGGNDEDTPYAMVVAPNGSATIAGYTYSQDFPTIAPLQPELNTGGGYGDAFVAQIADPRPPTPLRTTRTVTYTYDGLNRLTGADESGSTSNSYTYGYDLAGNRTSVTVNGTTTTYTYNAANQVTNAGYRYDAAGNLLNDGATSHTYDALHRVTSSGGVGATYNGDGVLVQRGATAYTQDLAVPLAQILNDGATTYVYDHGSTRLLADDGSARTWYVGDALGSVRMTLDGAGAVQGTVGYDPWGTPQGDLLGAFGFTGALQDGASNLLYLRARWYDPGQSTFTSRDPFAGFPATPYSLHPYQYAYSNPALWTDPSGKHPDPARRQLTKTEEKFIEAIIQVDYVRSYIGLDLALNFRVFDNDGSIGGNVAAPDTIPIVNFTLHEFYSIVPADDYATTSSVFGRLDHARRRQYLNIHIPPDWERSGNNYRYPSPLSARDLDFARGDPRPKKQYTRASIVAARTRRVITLWPVVAGSGYNPDIDGHWALVAWQDALNDGLIFYIGVKLSKRDRRLAKQPVLVYLPEEIAELLGGCPPLEPVPEGDGYQRPIPLPPGTLTPEPGSTLISIPGGNPYPPRRRNRP